MNDAHQFQQWELDALATSDYERAYPDYDSDPSDPISHDHGCECPECDPYGNSEEGIARKELEEHDVDCAGTRCSHRCGYCGRCS